jgi:hypothetical protein
MSLRVGAAGSRLQRGALLSTDVGASGVWHHEAQPAVRGIIDSPAVRYSLGATGFALRTDMPVGALPTTVAGGSWSAVVAATRWRMDLNARAARGRQVQSIDPRWTEPGLSTRPGTASVAALEKRTGAKFALEDHEGEVETVAGLVAALALLHRLDGRCGHLGGIAAHDLTGEGVIFVAAWDVVVQFAQVGLVEAASAGEEGAIEERFGDAHGAAVAARDDAHGRIAVTGETGLEEGCVEAGHE